MKKNTQTKDVEVIDPRWEKFVLFYAETGKVMDSAIRAGFSENYADKLKNRYPDKVSKGVAEAFSDQYLQEKHKELFNACRIEKMVFSHSEQDEDIRELIASMEGCKLLYIRNYSWGTKEKYAEKYAYVRIPNDVALDKALDKAYKLRGMYAPVGIVSLNVDGNKLFNDDQKEKTKSALRRFLNRGN